MPQSKSYGLIVAEELCEDLAREHLAVDLREDGIHPKLVAESFRAHRSYQEFPSSYRLLLQIEWYIRRHRHLYNHYFMLVEQWDGTYRIEDLQVDPRV